MPKSRPLRIFLCDLTHDTIVLVSDTIPINIGYIAAYAMKIYGDAVEFELFKFPQDVIKALKAGPPDETTTQALQEMRQDAMTGAVQAYLNLANGMSSRGSYQEATTYCNKALAIDPDNAEAKQARLTISTTTGWGMMGGGRRGGGRRR